VNGSRQGTIDQRIAAFEQLASRYTTAREAAARRVVSFQRAAAAEGERLKVAEAAQEDASTAAAAKAVVVKRYAGLVPKYPPIASTHARRARKTKVAKRVRA